MSAELDDLPRRAKAGEEQALAGLIVMLRPYLKRIAARKLHPRLRVQKDASDLVQETLAEGFADFGRFAGATVEELCGYLRRILERNALDTLRREMDAFCRSVDVETSLGAGPSGAAAAAQLVSDQTSPSGRVAHTELWDADDVRMVQRSQHLELSRQCEAKVHLGIELTRVCNLLSSVFIREYNQLERHLLPVHELGRAEHGPRTAFPPANSPKHRLGRLL